jgi:hypothetical protein
MVVITVFPRLLAGRAAMIRLGLPTADKDRQVTLQSNFSAGQMSYSRNSIFRPVPLDEPRFLEAEGVR